MPFPWNIRPNEEVWSLTSSDTKTETIVVLHLKTTCLFIFGQRSFWKKTLGLRF